MYGSRVGPHRTHSGGIPILGVAMECAHAAELPPPPPPNRPLWFLQKGQLMRHFKTERNAYFRGVDQRRQAGALVFPDTDVIQCRWLNAFVLVPGLELPTGTTWSNPEGKPFTGFIWWTDDLGERWKIGSHGDKAPYEQG